MQPRITTVLAGLITLSMVVFGQVCALRTLSAPLLTASESSVETQDAGDHGGCGSAECGGGSGEDEGACPSGASMCCSTWVPPGSRLILSPPSSLRLALNDPWLVPSGHTVVEDGSQEVSLSQLARPPGSSIVLLNTSSLSRRGPPARS